MRNQHGGYTYFTIYRNHSIWHNRDALAPCHEYAATSEGGEAPTFTIFAESFGAIRKKLDEAIQPCPEL